MQINAPSNLFSRAVTALGPCHRLCGGNTVPLTGFTAVPELAAGFDLLYEVALAAGYLFEELHLQGVLTSDFFLNEKRFLHGIDGRPDPERMNHFREALARARELARERQKTNPEDGEALFALTLALGMESDAESILQKKHMSALKRVKEEDFDNDTRRFLSARPTSARSF
jgi:hypothetical protein